MFYDVKLFLLYRPCALILIFQCVAELTQIMHRVPQSKKTSAALGGRDIFSHQTAWEM